MSNRIIVHFCGGAGLNLAHVLETKGLYKQGSGFCEVIPRYIDTSESNIRKLKKDNFWRVSSKNVATNQIHGSGSERRTNFAVIGANLEEYLTTYGYMKKVIGEFHIVIFSASGGTGSILGPLLVTNLRKNDIPVVAIVIGDSSNGLSCKNTLNTIASLDAMAKRVAKKPFTIAYMNNFAVDGKTSLERENTVNESIYTMLTTLSLFMSGSNDDIDTKDMVNFVSPDEYSTIKIAPALYSISIFTNDKIVNDPTAVNLLGRTLTVADESHTMELTLLHHKHGTIAESNVIDVIGEVTPLHILLSGECLNAEHKTLTNTVAEYETIMNSITSTELLGAGEDDLDGMIL